MYLRQWNGAESVFGQKVDIFGRDEDVVAVRVRELLFLFHSDNRAGDGSGRRHLDAFASNLIQQLSQGWIRGQIDAETTKGFHDRIARPVPDYRYVSPAAILHHQTLQHIVDLVDRKSEIDATISVHRPIMLEVSHAAGIEQDFRQRDLLFFQERCQPVNGSGCEAHGGCE